MNKPPKQTEYPIHELLEKRWSPRAFDDKPVNKQQMHQLLEAVRWSESSYNEQPWHLVYAFAGTEAFDQLLRLLNEFNQSWAKTAGALIVAGSASHFSQTGKENPHYKHDLGIGLCTASLCKLPQWDFMYTKWPLSIPHVRSRS